MINRHNSKKVGFFILCFFMVGLNTKKVEVQAYYGQKVERETLEDFRFYNEKLQKVFLRKGIFFKEVRIKDKMGVGYIIIANGHASIYEGVYTDADFLDILKKVMPASKIDRGKKGDGAKNIHGPQPKHRRQSKDDQGPKDRRPQREPNDR